MNAVYESIINMVKFYDLEIVRIKSKQQLLFSELKTRLREETGLDNPDANLGYWECPQSPIETCIYDGDEDPGHDNCIYCHEPFERK